MLRHYKRKFSYIHTIYFIQLSENNFAKLQDVKISKDISEMLRHYKRKFSYIHAIYCIQLSENNFAKLQRKWKTRFFVELDLPGQEIFYNFL